MKEMAQIALFTIISLFLLSSASPPTPHPFHKIYAFGDSYTDTGNTNSTTGPSIFKYVSSLPYGRTFFHHPTNRYSDGRLIIDFIAQSLSLPFLPPYLNTKADTSMGVNFAVAGSTAIRHGFFVKNNLTLNITPQSLQTQLHWFNKYLEAQGCEGNDSTTGQCSAAINEALFWVGEIGVNDYAYTIGSSVSGSTVQRLAIKSVTGFLRALLTKGAKYIVVQGLPTTGCLTLALYLSSEDDRDDIGCVATVNKQSYTHNALLQSQLQVLRKQFPQSVIVYADYWNAYHTVMKYPAKYGFAEPFVACCGSGGAPYNFQVFDACGSPSSSSCSDPNRYINWDGVHLTEAMYKVVSELFVNGSFTHPPFEDLLIRKKKETGMY
ncbi:GDSL esterase/lipase [Actinidia chinensis var. chinensis]|uniref:GDSL esterase/lipase n=1 Tax=Actinidia chinensis var. chinensis TaxID=1590841 RepID=A0A2R6QGF8_ACTCC|nr:GDSL esterase/lipase [Actinidia chinensis var. chinensis]